MATTTTIVCSATNYGFGGSYPYNGRDLYTGNSNGNNYAARIRFPSIASVVGTDRIAVTGAMLMIANRGDGNRAISVRCAASGDWGASDYAYGTTAGTGTWAYTYITLPTEMAEMIGTYTSPWYFHIANGGSYVRFLGISTDKPPKLSVTWDYVANTIHTTTSQTTLGTTATFTITPEVEGETHTLTYTMGSSSGTICTESSATSISWVPPLSLASEIPQSEGGMVTIDMTVYVDGAVQRREKLYLSVVVPSSVVPTIPEDGIGLRLTNDIAGYALTEITEYGFSPKASIENDYGASVSRIDVTIAMGSVSYSESWTGYEEISPGVLQCGEKLLPAFQSAGSATITVSVLDSRGRSVTKTSTVTVCAYSVPSVTAFNIDRCSAEIGEDELPTGNYILDDTGTFLLVSMSARCAPISPGGTELNGIDWSLALRDAMSGEQYTASGTGDTVLSVQLSHDIVSDDVGLLSVLDAVLTVTDNAGQQAVGYDTVPAGMAALSIAPGKKGVCVGGIAKGTPDDPMFESHFPGVFYSGLHAADTVISDGGIQGVTYYSTEEVKTGGLWIDGKPLYRQTFVFAAGWPNGNSIDLSQLDFEFIQLISCSANYRYNGTSDFWTNGFNWGGNADRLQFLIVNGTLMLRYGTNVSIYRGGWATLEYTKVSDSPVTT